MFPTTINLQSAGSSYDSQNKRLGTFYGHLESMRPIKSEKNPTCFAVVDIKIEGDRKPFQFYLNYNASPEKAQKSTDYLIGKIKELAIACGKPVDLATVRDRNWMEQTMNALISEKCGLWFTQSQGARGLELDFLEKAPEGATNQVAQTTAVQW